MFISSFFYRNTSATKFTAYADLDILVKMFKYLQDYCKTGAGNNTWLLILK